MIYSYMKFFMRFIEYSRILVSFYIVKKLIIVHQMGKVGSTAIEGSLNEASGCSVYHTHFLNAEKISEVDTIYQASGNWRMPRHLAQSYALKSHIGKIKEHGYVISMVREPVGRIISSYFQDITRLRPYLISARGFDTARAIDELILILEEKDEYGSSWFEREINDVFGINIYAYPFDKSKKCLCVKNKDIRLLIIRMEDLSLEYEVGKIISEFIGVPKPISLLKLNVGQEKWYADAYFELRQKIILDERFSKLVTVIYDESPYFTHFYDKAERDELKRKWLISPTKERK